MREDYFTLIYQVFQDAGYSDQEAFSKAIQLYATQDLDLPAEKAEGGIASLAPRRGRVTHPGGYAGSKWTEMFRDLGKSGASKKDFQNLYFKMKSQAVPIDLKQLLIHDMMMSGALPSELKHGGLAGILNLS